MSYEIYKTIKQNDDGTFDVTSASSNFFYNGGHIFTKFHMDWYAKNYPTLNTKQVKMLFLMMSCYCGDKFYPANWKKDLEIVRNFLNSKEDPYKTVYSDDLESLKSFLNEALNFVAHEKESNKAGKFIVKVGDMYITKKTSARVFRTFDKESAKVFKKSLKDLEMMFYSYKNYGVEIMEA